MSANGSGCDYHAFQYGMGIGFQNAAVHKRPRVSFVGIAKHVFDIALGSGGKFPFHAGGKPGPSAAPDARRLDFLDNFVRFHFQQGFCRCKISVSGNVFFNLFGLDQAAVAHDAQLLHFEKW